MSGNDPQGWGMPPSAEGPRNAGNPMNPFSSQGPPPPTGQLPPVQQFPPQQYPPQYQPQPQGGSGSVVKVVLIVLAVILALALVAAGIFWALMSRGGTTTAGTAPAQVTVTTVVPPSDPPAPAPDAGGARPANPALPGAAVAANSAARSGAPGGNFNNVYTGSSVTSQPFAAAVRDSFARHYTDTRKTSAVLNVYSPVTGQTYTMNCNDNGEFITCTGGNNAVVYIS